MEFLQRLAATVTQASLPGVARPALPSRFEPHAAPIASPDSPQPIESEEIIDERPRVLGNPAASRTTAAVHIDKVMVEARGHPLAPVAQRPPSAPSLERDSPLQPLPLVAMRSSSQPVARREPRATARTPVMASAYPVSSTVAPRTERGRAEAVAVRNDVAPAHAAVPAPLARHAPLSEATVAGRTALASDQHPVIHVTIDRIDVRAPAAPPAKIPSRSSRVATPTQSLSDYLRGHQTTGDAR